MNLVNHEDLEAAHHRLVDRLLQQLGNLVNAPVTGCVQLGVIDKTAAVDIAAGVAHTARLGGDAALPVSACAVERLGQNARHRGFAHAPRAGEQVGVVQAASGKRIAQGLHDVRLPHHFRKILGTVFAGKHEVGHAPILNWPARPQTAC